MSSYTKSISITNVNQKANWFFATIEKLKSCWKRNNVDFELGRLSIKHERESQDSRSKDILQMMPIEQKMSLGLYRLID